MAITIYGHRLRYLPVLEGFAASVLLVEVCPVVFVVHLYRSLTAVLVVELEVLLKKILREPATVLPTFRRCYVVMAFIAIACHGFANIPTR